MPLNFRRILIGIGAFIVVIFILSEVLMLAFGPVSIEKPSEQVPSQQTDVSVVSNGYNAASSPVTYQTSRQPKTAPSQTQSAPTGDSAVGEIMSSFYGTLMIVGVLAYMSRPNSKEWVIPTY